MLLDDYQSNIDAVEDYSQALNENISDLQEKRAALENEYNNAIEKRDSGIEPLTSSDKEIIETYETIYDLMRMVYEYTDPNTWKSMQIDSVFNTEGIEKTKDELIEMAKEGTLDEGTIQSYSKLSEVLEQNEVSASELCNELVALAKLEDDVQGSASSNTDISYESLTQTAESTTQSVDALRSAISSVNDAFAEQAENGSISVDSMLAMVDAGYATALQFDSVTGACTINKEAMLDLVQAKIRNQIADLQLLQSNIQQKLADDGNTARESSNGFYDLAKAKLAAASVEQLASMKQFNDAEAQINALQNAMKNIDKIGSGSYSTNAKLSSSKSSLSSDSLKDAFTQEYNILKHNLEMEYITEKQYYDSLDALNQKYFAGKSEYLDEYRQYEKEVYKGLQS